MKNLMILVFGITAIFLIACSFEHKETIAKSKESVNQKVENKKGNVNKTPVLVELFTSEG